MAASGIEEIDVLLDAAGKPIDAASDKPAIGAIQDLLRGHGLRGMPGLTSSVYGKYGKATKAALLKFCKDHCPSAIVDKEVNEVSKETLEALLEIEATNPIASQVYVTRKLDIEFTRYNRLACLVAIGEGQGAFTALCLNTDSAGLSVGLIQWAQRPGRLNELLDAIPKASLIAAMGTEAIADEVLAHTALPSGGVQAIGKPTDPKLDYTKNDWPAKFKKLCLDTAVQAAQVTLAARGFETRKAKFDLLVSDAKSERLVAYLLDVVNQFESAAPKFLKQAVDQGGLPSGLKERDEMLIDRVTEIANAKLEAIGKTIKNGKQKWADSFILKVKASRTSRGVFFRDWDGLSDSEF